MILKWRPTIHVQGDNIGGCVRDAFVQLFPADPRCWGIPNWVHAVDFPALCDELGARFLQGAFHVDYGVPCIVIYETRQDVGHALYISDTVQLHEYTDNMCAVIIRV